MSKLPLFSYESLQSVSKEDLLTLILQMQQQTIHLEARIQDLENRLVKKPAPKSLRE